MLRQPFVYISFKKKLNTFPYIRVDNFTKRETNPLAFITNQIRDKHQMGLVMMVDMFDYTYNLIHGSLINEPFDSVIKNTQLILMSETATYIPNGRYFNKVRQA
jgi:hypothetical protein